jgi:AcrR family transcriptional regulator
MTRSIRDPKARQRIVDVAARVVAERGLAGATVRAIATEAGVSTGFVMHYFPDKQALTEAVLGTTNRRAGERVSAAASRGRGTAALRAAVEALLPVDADRRREWQVWGAHWTGAPPGSSEHAGLVAARLALNRLLQRPLAEAVEDGELPAGLDLEYEAERLLVLAAGLGLSAGLGSRARLRALALRMLDDHLAALRAGALEGA